MKKIFLSITLIVFVATTFAQQDTLKGQKGDWGISINISGLINNITLQNQKDGAGNYVIFGRKYIKDDVAIRLGFNVAYDNQKWNSEDSIIIGSGSTALRQIDSTISRFDFSISGGYEKHLGSTKRLDPYFAGVLTIGRIGNTETTANTNVKDITGTDKTQHIIQQDGGFYFGIGGVAGFNYFIAPKFSLGAEFGYFYSYSKTGGDYNESVVNTPVSGSQSSTFSRGIDEQSINSLNVNSTASIMLSYFF
ncbi:MAG: outer membrane beta-barrel protein [Flavobacteriales bacterium]